jgi:6-phosphogluconolactonase
MASEPQVCVFPSGEKFFRASAEKFCEIGKRAIQEHGRYTVALSGGSTPKGLHQQLATTFASELPWDKVFFFWGDERHVPPDFPESNFRMAKDTLLSKLSIPSPHIFRMHGELPDANQAAGLYEQVLLEFFAPSAGHIPRLDFILLGIGPEGHTASLFPGTQALEENQHLVVGNWVAVHSTWRITCTYPVLNNGANVMFLVDGSGKADIVRTALKDPSANLPCQGVKPANGNLMWYLDETAGAKL